jgi:hypothetical protein
MGRGGRASLGLSLVSERITRGWWWRLLEEELNEKRGDCRQRQRKIHLLRRFPITLLLYSRERNATSLPRRPPSIRSILVALRRSSIPLLSPVRHPVDRYNVPSEQHLLDRKLHQPPHLPLDPRRILELARQTLLRAPLAPLRVDPPTFAFRSLLFTATNSRGRLSLPLGVEPSRAFLRRTSNSGSCSR